MSSLGCALIAACGDGEGAEDAGLDAEVPECTTAAMCPAPSSPCEVATCDDGECGFNTVDACEDDGGGVDAGTDAAMDAGTDASIDAATDASTDANMDAAADASTDAETDASADAGIDTGMDASTEAGTDTGVDADTDASTDPDADAGADADTDGGTDAATDGGTDAATEAGTDAEAPECTTAATCPPASSPCSIARCDEGVCGFIAASAGTTCRPSAGECDIVESCDGSSQACPADTLLAASTVCRAAVDRCDTEETCDGSSAACPAEAFVAANTVCRPATGLCDTEEICNGASSACPADTRTAVCISFTSLGRDLTVTSVDLNATGSFNATVTPGATVSLRLIGSWVDSNTSCPNCITQFYARLNGVFSMCLGSTTGDQSFDQTTTFTAPSTPGVYIINPTSSWEFGCLTDDTSADTTLGTSSLATLTVE